MDHESNPTPSGNERAEEIAQLRDRLSFYESFDQLIQDNITRAGDLLREASVRKSESELALRNNSAEVARQQLAERVTYRKIFSSLLDEVTTVQQNVERLARQVADALDDLEAVIPAQGELSGLDGDGYPAMPTFSSGTAGELNSGYDEESGSGLIADPADVELGESETFGGMEPVDEIVTADEAVQDTTDFGTAPNVSTYGSPGFQEVVQISVDRVSGELGAADSDVQDDKTAGIAVDLSAVDGSFEVESIGTDDELIQGDGGAAETAQDAVASQTEASGFTDEEDTESPNEIPIATSPEFPEYAFASDGESDSNDEPASEEGDSGEDESEDEWSDGGPGAATTLLVHGVPRATTALSLKRYLEGLEQVHAVEPREYAEGVLRLQVSSDRPVGIADLLGWPEAAGLEPVEVRDDFLEVRLEQ